MAKKPAPPKDREAVKSAARVENKIFILVV